MSQIFQSGVRACWWDNGGWGGGCCCVAVVTVYVGSVVLLGGLSVLDFWNSV